MIVIFHLISNLFYNLCKKRINARNSSWSNFTLTKLHLNDHPLAQRDDKNDIKFDPPMYKQRYERAADVLMYDKWKDQLAKVVDFGCGEFGFFVFLKHKLPVKELLFIDIDEFLLNDHLYRVYPLNGDYLQRRQNPLTVKVLVGSISQPDPALLDTDAVVALEIIEHLYPDTLDALPYNLFAFVCPKLVLFTTPNSDFNVLFNKLKKFRHPDHKFEWTREQFQSWATNVTLRFPRYTVQFDGIGLGPTGSENFGCCSQLAVFIRKDIICDNYIEEVITCTCESSTCKTKLEDDCCCLCKCKNCLPKQSFGICTYNSYAEEMFTTGIFKTVNRDSFKLVATINYPQNIDTRTEEEKTLDEIKYRMHQFGSRDSRFYNCEKDRVEIPLRCLAYESAGVFPSVSLIKSLLLKSNHQIEECLNKETDHLESCVIYDLEMESSASGSDAEASGYESERYDSENGGVSDWGNEEQTGWDDPPKDAEKRVSRKGIKSQLHLEVGTSKKQQEALTDSGYQKSPSVLDESPNSLPAVNKEAIPLEYKTLNIEKPVKLSNILSVFNNCDKINELDTLNRDRKYFSFASNLPHKEVMRKICQEISKRPVAGPSKEAKRENSLNKIDCGEEEAQHADLIGEFIPEEAPLEEPPAPQDAPVPPILLVENGDLANNNRDVEGNNYPAGNIEEPQQENDNAVDNLDRNHVNIDNNNEVEDLVPEDPVLEDVEENDMAAGVNVEVAWSSREALFDASSQVDLLEEFDLDASVAVVSNAVCSENYVVVANSDNDGAVLPPEESGFPNWLLQIFEEGEGEVSEDELHGEPHFYCQGDGLGVHPSTVAIDEDADDEGNGSSSDSSGSSSTGSSSSSSQGSADFANAENSPSIHDILPPDAPRNEDLAIVGQHVDIAAQSDDIQDDEETFQSAEGSESNLVSSSCTQ